jgi:hypothetical protein
MPGPIPGVPRKATPRPAPAAQPAPQAAPESKEVRAARRAVEAFTEQYQLLMQMRQDWEQNFPDAKLALDDVHHQEDAVQEAIKRAKPLVAAAKMTIGDFIAQRKWEKPHYDEEALTKILGELENGGEVFATLLQQGLVASVTLQKEAAVAWFAQHPEYEQVFKDAFRDEKEMTPAVTVPKV